jgi:hypothetical protein
MVSYGSTPVFEAVFNVTNRITAVPFALFILPWAWLVWRFVWLYLELR